MRDWIPWRLDEPRALARYVLPDLVGEYLALPGPSGDSPVQRLGAVYAAIAAAGIRYAHEPPADQADTQQVRSPAEVLWAPKHATCLDLAIVFAGACLKAGLAPLIVLIERTGGVAGRHALVGIWAQDPPDDIGDEPDAAAEVWGSVPAWLPGLVRRTIDDAGRPLVVLDPVGAATGLPSSPARGLDAPFAQAIADGAARLLEGGWSWAAGVNLAQAWRGRETYHPAARPAVRPLREPYLEARPDLGPLQLLRADYQMVRFQPRDELTVLRHWCAQSATSQQLGLAIIEGAGGSGKTRLALELARRLQDQGWYAGLLLHSIEGTSWSESVDWLASIVSPALIIVDYADARVGDTKALLRALASRAGPAVVVLTARTVEGEWLTELQGFIQRDGQVLTQRRFELPPGHPDSIAIFQHAVAAFAASGRDSPQPSASDEVAGPAAATAEQWTTLDYVLLGLLAARTASRPPALRRELYDAVLEHEQRYWADVYRDLTRTTASPLILRRAAACLTLLAPTPSQAGTALRSLEELAEDGQWRENIRRMFAECFYTGPGEALALRPDPVADQLAVEIFSGDAGLMDRCLASLDEARLPLALANLNRASSTTPDTVTAMLTGWLRRHPGQWHAVLIVAAAQAGSALAALEDLAGEEPAVLPVADLAQAIPLGHVVLARLGLTADTRRLHALRATSEPDPAHLAALLDRVGGRQAEMGDRDAALATFTEGVSHYRALAQASPAHLPDLANALSNLAVHQAETGDRDGALATITEGVSHYRTLAQASPAHLPDLANALNKLSAHQAATGDWDGALATVTEAVGHYRTLAQASLAIYLPGFANALNNLAVHQGETGDQAGALATITEAIGHYRTLAQASPAIYLPGLAGALNNLSLRQAATGDQAGALATITEAVGHQGTLAQASPAAYLPGLATMLNNLSLRQAETGNRDGALATITEAVGHYRALAQASPAAYLPDFANALSNLAVQQGETGNRDGALATITEAVGHCRALAQASPAAYLPDLARALNNLAVQQGATGNQAGALATITEAVGHHRALAQASPAIYLPDLARALNNLAVQQAAAGNQAGALATITEAVGHYRALARASPAHLPGLAASLNSLSNRQAAAGDRDGALATITEAVGHYRTLARASPAHLPDLASALHNLAVQQAESGDRDGALATVTEAVSYYRALAQASPAAYLPGLASALNNRSLRQAETGDRDGALATVTEAVSHYRALAQASPAHLSGLASALNNRSLRQAETGKQVDALATSTEAVQIRRALAQASPAHLPDLADALNSLSLCQAETGDRDGALTTITEAVSHYRALAQASPAHLPGLARTLNNLSVRQVETGDRDGALTTITEAVSHCRALARASPAYLPGLASALNNLSLRQAETGDRDGALTRITEAIGYYRALALASPGAYLPDLARMLNNLTRLSGHLAATEGDAPWHQAIAAFDDPLPRAELRTHYAQALVSNGRRDAAAEQLAAATAEAASGDAAALGRARRAIRSAAIALGANDPRLPGWATRPVPDADTGVIDTWAAQHDWPSIDVFLTRQASNLQDDGFRTSLSVLADLFPGTPALALLQTVLADADNRGLDAVLADGRAAHADAELIREWLAIPTWEESARFLGQHHDELTSPRIRQLLDDNRDDEIARQHLAIVDLAATLPADEVYQIVTDSTTARERALDLIEAGDLTQLALVLGAAPAIAAVGITGAFIHTIIALANGDSDTARQIAEIIAQHAKPSQREALTIRLRAFATHQPDHAPALEIADIITSATASDT